jgi:RNA polymerase sigma factor (sigma-70 family)
MAERDWLAEQFEQNRGRLRGVAYRILGSLNEADDAVQEAWLRLSRTDEGSIENLGAWLTTVVARVCLDMLRSRNSRREEPIGEGLVETVTSGRPWNDPEQEVLLADSVGLALLVVLGRLAPAERVAFVLHDMFALPFEEIAGILGRTPAAARQLASRARRRVQGASGVSEASLAEQREVISAFLSALRAGDIEGMVAVLDPDVLVRVDEAAARPGGPREIHGARNWASGAVAFASIVRFVQPALVNGSVGLVWAPRGRLLRVLTFTLKQGKIAQVEIIADRARLNQVELAVLNS